MSAPTGLAQNAREAAQAARARKSVIILIVVPIARLRPLQTECNSPEYAATATTPSAHAQRNRRRRSRRPVVRLAREASLSGMDRRGDRAESGRRHLRLRRGVLAGCARLPGARRPRPVPQPAAAHGELADAAHRASRPARGHRRQRILRDRAARAASVPPGAVRAGRRAYFVRCQDLVHGGARRGRPDRCSRWREFSAAARARSRLRATDRLAHQQVRLVRHRQGVRLPDAHLPHQRAWHLGSPPLSLQPHHEYLPGGVRRRHVPACRP